MDPVLTLYDSYGNVVDYNDDYTDGNTDWAPVYGNNGRRFWDKHFEDLVFLLLLQVVVNTFYKSGVMAFLSMEVT